MPSKAEVTRNNASPVDRSWHSLEWLQYAYLQEGHRDAARMKIDSASKLVSGATIDPSNADARFAANALALSCSMDASDYSAWRNRPLHVAAFSALSALSALPTPTARAWAMTMTNAYQCAVAAVYGTDDRTLPQAVSQRFCEIADSLTTTVGVITICSPWFVVIAPL